jgi:hypothetical protein
VKLYKIIRKDLWNYDEYDSFVVRAENEERALELCREREGSYRQNFFIENVTIIELNIDGIEEVILGSFNAG